MVLTDFYGLFKICICKLASKTEGEAKVTACCLGDLKSQITPEKLPFYDKEQLF